MTKRLIAVTVALAARLISQDYTVSTVAGYVPVADSGRANRIYLANPEGVAADGAGNVYIADTFAHKVRRVDADGQLTTVAGTGSSGLSGDGGAGAKAQIALPGALAVDAVGNLYISDRGNHTIRKVDLEGNISTVAGFGRPTYTGDGRRAVLAGLRAPRGMAFDAAGNLFIADTENHRVRRIDTAGIITTVAGSSTIPDFAGDGGPAVLARLNAPEDVAVDFDGTIYIADGGNNRIRKVDPSGIITTAAGSAERGYAGDGRDATLAALATPSGLLLYRGKLYIADRFNTRIRALDLSDGTIQTAATMGGNARMAIDRNGRFVVTQPSANRINLYDPVGGYESQFAGAERSPSNGMATSLLLNFPYGVAVDGAGSIYVADTVNHRIAKVTPSGFLSTVAGTGTAGFLGDDGPATQARLWQPAGIALDGAGNLYIADVTNNRIRRVSPDGIITTVAGDGTTGYGGDDGPATAARLNRPWGVAVDGAGNLYIADSGNHVVRKVFASRGTIVTVAGTPEIAGAAGDGGPARLALLNFPRAVAVDSTGTNIYIADSNNAAVRHVNARGTILPVAGQIGTPGLDDDPQRPGFEQRLNSPQGVAVDRGGVVYIADSFNNRIRRVDPATGFMSVIAGGGDTETLAGPNYAGEDGTNAIAARFSMPAQLTVDTDGSILLADRSNGLVRRLTRVAQ